MSPDDGLRTNRMTDDDLLELARRGREELDEIDHEHVASLWDGIAAAAFGDPEAASAAPVSGEASTRAEPSTGHPPRPSAGPTGAHGTIDLQAERARRRPARLVAALAAVAAVVAVVAGGVWLVSRPPAAVPIASFAMEALDDRAPSAVSGEVLEVDGVRTVEVDLAELPDPGEDAFYELWLLDLDAGELVSLGPVNGQRTFRLPDAIDVGTYPTIDVSVEPTDGDPTHSGDSVLRGPISAAGETAG